MIERLPNYESAIIDVNKLAGYSLNTEHPEGKHKAFVFLSVLGTGQGDKDELRLLILDAINVCVARVGKEDKFGRRYSVEFPCTRNERTAIIKTAWIIRVGEDFPRLTSCYIDRA